MVSNNLLASLLVLAIIVSVAGVYSIMSAVSLIQVPASPFTGITGAAVGYTNVTVGQVAAISLTVNTVDFGTMNVNENNDTVDDSPWPFEVQNDGNVNVNVTLNATKLWDQDTYNVTGPNYQFKCGNSSELDCPAGSLESAFTNMPVDSAAVQVIAGMEFATSKDMLQVEINVTVPPAEPTGIKSSVVTFTGFQA